MLDQFSQPQVGQIRQIICKETADMRAELKGHSTILKNHSKPLHEHSTALQELQQEQRRQGVLFEDLRGDMKTVLEMLGSNLKVQAQVTKHEQGSTW